MMHQLERQRIRELEYIERGYTLEQAMLLARGDFPVTV